LILLIQLIWFVFLSTCTFVSCVVLLGYVAAANDNKDWSTVQVFRKVDPWE
jgi:hypothetical protein